jgi:hypothetical protein
MTKDLNDIAAAMETHLGRARSTLSKHIDNTFKACAIIAHPSRTKDMQLNLVEFQEEIQDIAEIIDALRADALDILKVHLEFVEHITNELSGK